jgi:hypothetical protein
MGIAIIGILLCGGLWAVWYGLSLAGRRERLATRLGGSLLASAGVAGLYYGIALIRAVLRS